MNLSILKELFAGFVRTRGIGRHFRRLLLLDSLAETGVSREVPPTLSQTLIAAAKSDADVLLKQLDSHPHGLSEAQADAARERFGLNEIEQEKPPPWWLHLWHCYKRENFLKLAIGQELPVTVRQIIAGRGQGLRICRQLCVARGGFGRCSAFLHTTTPGVRRSGERWGLGWREWTADYWCRLCRNISCSFGSCFHALTNTLKLIPVAFSTARADAISKFFSRPSAV